MVKEMMNSRERVRRAIHFQNPDRVPHYLPDGLENDILWLWTDRPDDLQPLVIQQTMVYGSVQDIRAYVRRMIDTLGSHGGGLISMAYSSPDAVQQTPEKLAAMCAAFREYGVYP